MKWSVGDPESLSPVGVDGANSVQEAWSGQPPWRTRVSKGDWKDQGAGLRVSERLKMGLVSKVVLCDPGFSFVCTMRTLPLGYDGEVWSVEWVPSSAAWRKPSAHVHFLFLLLGPLSPPPLGHLERKTLSAGEFPWLW